jgi:hypothetical protein
VVVCAQCETGWSMVAREPADRVTARTGSWKDYMQWAACCGRVGGSRFRLAWRLLQRPRIVRRLPKQASRGFFPKSTSCAHWCKLCMNPRIIIPFVHLYKAFAICSPVTVAEDKQETHHSTSRTRHTKALGAKAFRIELPRL